jgi:hypothetical protein
MNPIKRSFLIVAALAAGIITAASPGCMTDLEMAKTNHLKHL